MALIQIQSSNHNLSHVLRKNPNSGMLVKSIRKGHGFGFFNDDNTQYNLLFRDGPDEQSYTEEGSKGEFEYLNKYRYCSSMAVLNMLSEFLASATKEVHELDLPVQNFACINRLEVRGDAIPFLRLWKEKYAGYEVEVLPIEKQNLVKIIISGLGTVKDLLNLIYLISFASLAYNDEHAWIDNSMLIKLCSVMQELNVGYELRNAIKVRFMSTSVFEEVGKLLDTETMKFTRGNTQQVRQKFVRDNLIRGNSILDIGCGDGSYISLFSKDSPVYLAFDRDEEVAEHLEWKIAKKQRLGEWTNVAQIDGLVDEQEGDILKAMLGADGTVLLMEVIEHVPDAALKVLLTKLHKWMRYGAINQILITTPNKEFNTNYNLEGALRHPDHVKEYTELELTNLLNDYFGEQASGGVYGLGDSVKGQSSILGARIKGSRAYLGQG